MGWLELRAPGPEAAQAAGSLDERLEGIRHRIRAVGADPATVRIVAVTKGFGTEAVEAAVAAGLMEFGENYAHELLRKQMSAPPDARWHFLGAVQTNKIGRLGAYVSLWQSVDTSRQIEALAERIPGASVLVQVNLERGLSRRGAPEQDVPRLVDLGRQAGLDVRGLMAVGPRRATRDEVSASFARVADLGRRLGAAELSMGMSDDFELAVQRGATIIRLGRALFGQRPSGAPSERMYAGAPWQGGATLGL